MVPPGLVHHHATFHLLHSLGGNFVFHFPFPFPSPSVVAVAAVDVFSFPTWKTVATMAGPTVGMKLNARYSSAAARIVTILPPFLRVPQIPAMAHDTVHQTFPHGPDPGVCRMTYRSSAVNDLAVVPGADLTG